MITTFRIMENGDSFQLHEVYYERNTPKFWTKDPAKFVNKTREGLIDELEQALKDAKRFKHQKVKY